MPMNPDDEWFARYKAEHPENLIENQSPQYRAWRDEVLSRGYEPMPTFFVIDYYAEGCDLPSNCYPDFCYSLEEAERIAPKFLKQCGWAVRYTIRRHDTGTDDDEGVQVGSGPSSNLKGNSP